MFVLNIMLLFMVKLSRFSKIYIKFDFIYGTKYLYGSRINSLAAIYTISGYLVLPGPVIYPTAVLDGLSRSVRTSYRLKPRLCYLYGRKHSYRVYFYILVVKLLFVRGLFCTEPTQRTQVSFNKMKTVDVIISIAKTTVLIQASEMYAIYNKAECYDKQTNSSNVKCCFFKIKVYTTVMYIYYNFKKTTNKTTTRFSFMLYSASKLKSY